MIGVIAEEGEQVVRREGREEDRDEVGGGGREGRIWERMEGEVREKRKRQIREREKTWKGSHSPPTCRSSASVTSS